MRENYQDKWLCPNGSYLTYGFGYWFKLSSANELPPTLLLNTKSTVDSRKLTQKE